MFVCVCVSNCEGGDANVLQVPYYHVLPCLSKRKGENRFMMASGDCTIIVLWKLMAIV